MRVTIKKVRDQAYAQVVADVLVDDKWRQRCLASFGRLSPESHAQAVVAAVVLQRLDEEPKGPLRHALEAEVVRVCGPDAVNALRRLRA